MCRAAAHADAEDGEPASLVQEPHDKEARRAASQREDRTVEACEEEACDEHTDHVHRDRVASAEFVQGDHDDQIGESQLDARNANIEGENGLDIGEYERQRREDSGRGDSFTDVI